MTARSILRWILVIGVVTLLAVPASVLLIGLRNRRLDVIDPARHHLAARPDIACLQRRPCNVGDLRRTPVDCLVEIRFIASHLTSLSPIVVLPMRIGGGATSMGNR